jgi:hypothetical protein
LAVAGALVGLYYWWRFKQKGGRRTRPVHKAA